MATAHAPYYSLSGLCAQSVVLSRLFFCTVYGVGRDCVCSPSCRVRVRVRVRASVRGRGRVRAIELELGLELWG